jgi:alkylation response protein AidB-like acyl-CoA dehydrogenase
MDFNDSPEEAAFRAEARAFLDAHARRKLPEEDGSLILFSDEREQPDAVVERAQAWQKVLYDNGWAVLTWPTACGGRDATPVQNFIWNDELSHYDIPDMGIYLVGHGMVGPTIITHGTDDHMARFIPKMAEGAEIWCQLWSEPNAGSDLASLQTKAERTHGGDFVLNGQKVWTTGAHFSRYGLIVARTDPDVPKHRGITCFVIDMRAKGVAVRPLRQITGGADFNEVFLDDVEVPAENVVGDVNDGWRVAMTTLMNERYAVGMSGFGAGMIQPVLRLARERKATGDPLVRQQLAAAWIRNKILNLTGYRSLTAIAKGNIPGPEGSIMKMVRTHLIAEIADVGTKILGLDGILWADDGLEDGQWALNAVGAIGSKIGGGTDDIMRNILGERVLGLPKEPELDRAVPFRELRVGTLR